MSTYLEQQLKASGVAQVLVILKGPVAARSATDAVGNFFTQAPTTPQRAIASAMSLRVGGGGRRTRVKEPPAMRVYPNLGIALGTVDREGIAALRKDHRHVEQVVSAPIFSLIRPRVRLSDTKPSTLITWGIDALEANKVWKKGWTGKGVLVGHLDTGIDGKHRVFKASNEFDAAIDDFAEFDELGEIVNPTPQPHDTDNHGTHTAATIAGRPFKSGKKTSYIGVAPAAKLISAIVIEGGDVVARVLGGMNWAVGKGVRILSMSLGIRGYLDDFRPVTKILRKKNVLPVFAVGNEGPGTSRSPGNYVEALSVGALDRQRIIADFSSSQRFARKRDPFVPDVVGPGVDVISAKPGNAFQSLDGTSMATPHIAGLAALLFEAVPAATPDQVEKAIFDSCERGPGLPEERANRGLPNAMRALEALLA